MTDWNAAGYSRIAQLQEAMAAEALGLLKFQGTERVLDVGCGNGKVTAQIAARVPDGTVVGVDPSAEMISFASVHFGPAKQRNLRFETADARSLPFHAEFDFVVSFNALHWIPNQEAALSSIHAAMKQSGFAQLRLVPAGKRKSLENVIEETRRSTRWTGFFHDFNDPYLHWTPEQYATAAERNGFRVLEIHAEDKAWDFKSRSAFFAFGMVTFVEWTKRVPEERKPEFVSDVLDRYQQVAAERPGKENTFKFYQMDIKLAPS